MDVDILKALKLCEQGLRGDAVAKSLGIPDSVLFMALNNGKINYTKVESMLRKGATAQDIYDKHYKVIDEVIPSEDYIRLLYQEQIKINSTLREILLILKDYTDNSMAVSDKKVFSIWSQEEIDFLITAVLASPDGKNYIREFHKEYPGRTNQAVYGKVVELRKRGKLPKKQA